MTGPAPVLNGYRVEWDETNKEWVATHETLGTELRGRNRQALEQQRAIGVIAASGELLDICRYAMANGYTPPPPQP